MELHNLKPAEGSVKEAKRIGRGPGSGLGGTSTRGHKGAKSRSGYSKKIGFEGGQMPMHCPFCKPWQTQRSWIKLAWKTYARLALSTKKYW